MKALQHLKTINHHKWLVCQGCFKVGLYKQGLLHDLSSIHQLNFWWAASSIREQEALTMQNGK